MAEVSFKATLSRSGVSTALSGEATSSLSSTVYQITDAAKRVLDPDVLVEIEDNGSPVAPEDFTVDYLRGTVTSLIGAFTGPVTVSGSYLPVLPFAEVRSFDLNFSGDLLDVTVMSAATAWRARMQGLKDFTGSFTGLDMLLTDLDTNVVPFELWADGELWVLDLLLDGGTSIRAFVISESISEGGSSDDLLEATLNFSGSAVQGQGISIEM